MAEVRIICAGPNDSTDDSKGFTLSDPSCSTPGCPFSGGGKAGPCTANVGTLSYDEISDVIAGGATVTLDKEAAVKQATYGTNQWVSYDDKETLAMKVDYANKVRSTNVQWYCHPAAERLTC